MKRPCLHLICNAHLDPVWQWTWEEGWAEAVSTFREASRLLSEHDRLIFTHNESVLYRWVKDVDKQLFRAIRRWVEKGRWVIGGGWDVQPDLNLPPVESLIRHVAEGRRFFFDEFGVRPEAAYNFDSFGHSGGLPQILVEAGYKLYIHMRPQARECGLPADLYRWRGVDGSLIAAYRIAVGLYHTEYGNVVERLKQGVDLALCLGRDVPVFWGIGNHGGGATRQDLEAIDRFAALEKRVRIVYSSPEHFWKAIRKDAGTAPLFEGDLQKVFTGCYTSLSRVKRRMLQSAGNLVRAETLRSLTWFLGKQEYPKSDLSRLWREHLFNDFHDILPGSCIEPAEQDALDHYGSVVQEARRLGLEAVFCLARGVPDQVENAGPEGRIPIVVVRSCGAGNTPIEAECMISLRPKWKGIWRLDLFSQDGKRIPCQEEQPEALLPFNGWRRKIVFMADGPTSGAALYWAVPREDRSNVRLSVEPGKVSAAPTFRIGWNRGQGLVDCLDGPGGENCLRGCLAEPVVVEDEGDSWGTGQGKCGFILGRFENRTGKSSVVEQGPIRTVVESILRFNSSWIRYRTMVYADWPVLEIRLRMVWNEIRKRVVLVFPTSLGEGDVLVEVPGGAISRAQDNSLHVLGRWFFLRGKAGSREVGFGVCHNGLFGMDAGEGTVRLSLCRSVAYCHEQGLVLKETPEVKYMDLGVHEVRLFITAGEPARVLERLPGLADFVQAGPMVCSHIPPGCFVSKGGVRDIPVSVDSYGRLLDVRPSHVRLLGAKQSEDGKALLVRIAETLGQATRAELDLLAGRYAAKIDMRPFEIKTIRFERGGISWKVVNMIDEGNRS